MVALQGDQHHLLIAEGLLKLTVEHHIGGVLFEEVLYSRRKRGLHGEKGEGHTQQKERPHQQTVMAQDELKDPFHGAPGEVLTEPG